MQKILIAAATAAIISVGAFAAPASAASLAVTAEIVKVHGPGHGHWNPRPGRPGGHWKAPPRRQAGRNCRPITRWMPTGPRWNQRWQQVVVGWDCKRGPQHRPYR